MTVDTESIQELREGFEGCSDCGKKHLYAWQCRFDLHGEADSFHTSCAVCETEIESNEPRESDRFGNLYCSPQCAMQGQDKLLSISMRD